MLLVPVGLWFLKLSGHGAEIYELEKEYFKILMWCGGGMTLSSALSSFFTGRGKTFVISAPSQFSLLCLSQHVVKILGTYHVESPSLNQLADHELI